MAELRFAIGSPQGPRSSVYRVAASEDRSCLRVEGGTALSPFRATIAISPPAEDATGGAGPGPVTREVVRRATAAGSWGRGGEVIGEWPGRRVAPQVWQRFSLYFPTSGLRAFAEAEPGGPAPIWIPAPDGFGHVTVSFLEGPERIPWQLAGPAEQRRLLASFGLPGGRELRAVCSLQGSRSPLEAAGMFGAIRKRRPQGISQEDLIQPAMRLVFACEIHGEGLLVEIAGDIYYISGAC
jgi:hypothetical protein